MSIRLIAREVYRLRREVERLEEEKRSAPEYRRGEIGDRLRKVRAEHRRMCQVLEGAKSPPEYRRPR